MRLRGTLLPLHALVSAIPVLVVPVLLNVLRLPELRWVLTHTRLHASTSHWPVSSVCPYRFILIPGTHIQPSFQPLPIPPKLPNQLAWKDWSARLYVPDGLPFLGT